MGAYMDSISTSLLGGRQIQTTTYKEQAYQLIKDAILYNRFQSDVIYSQETICNELGISRTPVREALLELQKEGYITFHRGKGMQIVPVTEKDEKDVLEARILLEANNAQLAAERGSAEDLQAIETCLLELKSFLTTYDSKLLYRYDHQFHRLIAKATGNDLFYHQTCQILDYYLRFEIKNVYNTQSIGLLVYQEHEDVQHAICSRDGKLAAQAMTQHLKRSFARTLEPVWKKMEEKKEPGTL